MPDHTQGQGRDPGRPTARLRRGRALLTILGALVAGVILALVITETVDLGLARVRASGTAWHLAKDLEDIRVIETRALALGRVAPEDAATIDNESRALDELIQTMRQQGLNGSRLDRLQSAIADYRTTLADELRMLHDGDVLGAQQLAARSSPSSFESLDADIGQLAAEADASAKKSDKTVDTLAYTLVPLITILGITLMHRLDKRRAAAAVQQVQDEQAARFRSLVQNATDLVAVIDDTGVVTYIAPSCRRMLMRGDKELLNTPFEQSVYPEDRGILREALEQARQLNEPVSISLRVDSGWGRWRSLDGTVLCLLHDAALGGFVLNLRDVTEQHRLEAQLTYQAFHDSLTGLANRALFRDRTEHALARVRRTGATVAVLLVDLDRFKMINDSLGHAVGDEVLVAVTERCRACMRPGDTLARLGGDEFAVLLEEADPATAKALADRFVSVLDAPISVAGTEVSATASIGIAVSGRDLATVEDLMRAADAAMYEAKAAGRDTSRAFEVSMHQRVVDRVQLLSDLRQAVQRRQLSLAFLPTVNLRTFEVESVEALLRWRHERLGNIPAREVIELAEEAGVIGPLGRWVLYEACRVGAELGSEHLVMSVNIASRQLIDPAFVDDVRGALSAARLDPKRLMLEVSESAFSIHRVDVVNRLVDLRQLGVRLAMDDFGAGMSSLSWLRQLPLDAIKIDGSFINDAQARQADGGAFVAALVNLAKTLRLSTIAEGIELDAQLSQLVHAGCDAGQGHLFTAAVTEQDLARTLTSLARSRRLAS